MGFTTRIIVLSRVVTSFFVGACKVVNFSFSIQRKANFLFHRFQCEKCLSKGWCSLYFFLPDLAAWYELLMHFQAKMDFGKPSFLTFLQVFSSPSSIVALCDRISNIPFLSVYSQNCKFQQIFCYFQLYFQAIRWLLFSIMYKTTQSKTKNLSFKLSRLEFPLFVQRSAV